MDPLTLIALLSALIKLVGQGKEAVDKIVANLKQNKELTPEERKAFEEVMASDYAKPHWQPND